MSQRIELRTIITTGAALIEDVKRLAHCDICLDTKIVDRLDSEGRSTGYKQRCICSL